MQNRMVFFMLMVLCLGLFVQLDGAENKRPGYSKHLERLRTFFAEDDGNVNPERNNHRISSRYETWDQWLEGSGELPPDFDSIPSSRSLPDPLLMENGRKVVSEEQWLKQRKHIKRIIQHWLTGRCPKHPENIESQVLEEKTNGTVTEKRVLLTFGPAQKARLNLILLIPEGKGPFPVFLTQWSHINWARLAVRRGYLACIYAGSDGHDDTEDYMYLWPDHDFTRLMRRAWGAGRAVDYLYTLPIVDKKKIGITGHSRNGKQSLWAAAMDERITACIPSSGGTGGEIPFRYAREKYRVETIKVITARTASWLHPRMRFFVANETRLPFDQNFLMALIAPRPLMLSSAYTEEYGNPWGIEQAFLSAREVYRFLDAGDNLKIRLRPGGHGTLAEDIEAYLDFFDSAFGRKTTPPANTLFWNYSFERWKKISGENIEPNLFPDRQFGNLIEYDQDNEIAGLQEWETKRDTIRKKIRWILGEEPPMAINPGPGKILRRSGDSYLGNMVNHPDASPVMGRSVMPCWNGIGDYQFGYLYYPLDSKGNVKGDNLPVLIYLHNFSYSHGFSPAWPYTNAFDFEEVVSRGIAIFTMDMTGFGSRIKEGTKSYERYPEWSKMGKMVADVRAAVTALSNMERLDSERIYVFGYSLGATIGLYSTAIDDRIAGLAAFCGFTPFNYDRDNHGAGEIKSLALLHGLIPRLGFFTGSENRVPFDYNELLSCIAPRKLLICAPRHNQDASFEGVSSCMEQAAGIYRLYGEESKLEFLAPDYYNHFSANRQQDIVHWIDNNILR